MNRTDVTSAVSAAVYGPNARVRVKARETRTDAVARVQGLGKVRLVITEEPGKTGVGIWGRYPMGCSKVFITHNLDTEELELFAARVMDAMRRMKAAKVS